MCVSRKQKGRRVAWYNQSNEAYQRFLFARGSLPEARVSLVVFVQSISWCSLTRSCRVDTCDWSLATRVRVAVDVIESIIARAENQQSRTVP